MKKIALNDVIKKQMKNPKFAEAYQREMIINAIATMVVKLRQTNNFTQQPLTNVAGTSQSVIARLETGADSRMPSLELLSRIAKAANAKLTIGFEQLE
jgi:DNA-binding XRE family transcriptional regulator